MTSAPTATVLGWQDDPGPPGAPNQPVVVGVPDLARPPFPSAISTPAPAAGRHDTGTPAFRYWAAADALRRVGDYWGRILGDAVAWHPTVGAALTVELDAGEDLNAYYDREGLKFFHGIASGRTFFSGESPDVVCHEFGHAVLDALRPQLWDVTSAEPPAFHEAFGDMSAMLSVLQLTGVRQAVLADTSGILDRSSRVSRLAEQLGWAIRQSHPDAVDPDCLRNAANSLFFQDPIDLPPSAPASRLSSEPHSLSRVFSGAFLTALAGMYAAAGPAGEAALQQVTVEAGTLLVAAVRATPVVVSYFSQMAAHMIAADADVYGGRHGEALRTAFLRHGILSLQDATAPLTPAEPIGAAGAPASELPRVALRGDRYGLPADVIVTLAAEPNRFAVASAAPDLGRLPGAAQDRAAASFVEDLFRRGQVVVADNAGGRPPIRARANPSHELRREGDGLLLVRRHFDCGLGTEPAAR
jgi:hypothetical protein